MRDILDPMIHRLFALMVALAMTSAPVALEICQIRCESRGNMPADHAACHERSGTSQQLSPVNGLCDHGTEETPSVVAARNSDAAVSLPATVPSIDSIIPVPTRGSVSVHDLAWTGRPGIPLAIPLRV